MNGNKDRKSHPLSVELPYWEFFKNPLPHVVLSDSSIVCGFETQTLDIECLDDSEVNNFTISLRNCLNSISEGSYLQFFLDVDSDYRELIKKHQALRIKNRKENKNHGVNPLILDIAKSRDEVFRQDIANGSLYRPRLKVFLRRECEALKKNSFFKSEKEFVQLSKSQYEELFETIIQDIESLKNSFENMGLNVKDLEQRDFVKDIYRFFNPMRSQSQPVPKIQPVTDKNLIGSNQVEGLAC